MISRKDLDMQILLLQIEKVCVSKVACSNKHSLICTNTGAVFSWGENDFGQLGFMSRKKS